MFEDIAPGLFDEPPRVEPEPKPELTAGERLRARQADRIRHGLHPLSLAHGPTLRLHPDVSRDPDDRTSPGPRCGGCAHRRQMGGHARSYPKCLAGARFGHNGPSYPYASMSEATDVRAWWPACTLYQPREDA